MSEKSLEKDKLIKSTITRYKSYVALPDEDLIAKALNIAIEYHTGQLRASGEQYYNHPIAVAEIIAEMRLDTDSIITALLHDTIEDTKLTLKDIEKIFGTTISKMVDGVTKLTRIKFKKKNIIQAENFRKLLIAMSNDVRILLVKLADRLHNMRTIQFIKSKEKRKKISIETLEIYAPLAERIGIQKIKTELQDIAFEVLHPKTKASILKKFHSIEQNNNSIIDQVITELYQIINANERQHQAPLSHAFYVF